MRTSNNIVHEITQEHIILVDEHDQEVGIAEKISAHIKGQMHRCFSIFIFNAARELLLQRRADNKYHSGGLWTNTCCGHPRPGEDTQQAAHRRLREEMGFDCPLEEKFSFTYRVAFDNGFIENEFDHVFLGSYNHAPQLNPDEAQDWKWVGMHNLKQDMKINQQQYTHWIKLIIDRF